MIFMAPNKILLAAFAISLRQKRRLTVVTVLVPCDVLELMGTHQVVHPRLMVSPGAWCSVEAWKKQGHWSCTVQTSLVM